MLVERIMISSNATDLVDYTMPSTSITGEEFLDKLKWCSYIVNDQFEEGERQSAEQE